MNLTRIRNQRVDPPIRWAIGSQIVLLRRSFCRRWEVTWRLMLAMCYCKYYPTSTSAGSASLYFFNSILKDMFSQGAAEFDNRAHHKR